MTEETWHKHTPGDPMPCKCGDSVVEVRFSRGGGKTAAARRLSWGESKFVLHGDITDWRFIERKGEDVIQRCAECDCGGGSSECNWIKSGPADPYDALEWDKDDTAIVALKKPGQPEWVRDGDLVRFHKHQNFERADAWFQSWDEELAFQIKRRPVLTPAVPQVLEMLSVAIDDEANAIRSAARRANIEVPG